jgi:hypothetical protein
MKSNAIFFNLKQAQKAAEDMDYIRDILEGSTGGKWSDGAIVAMLLKDKAEEIFAAIHHADEVKHAS